MKKILIGGLVLTLFSYTGISVEACHHRERCGTTAKPALSGPVNCVPLPATPSFVEQKVTAYRPEWRVRQVERMVPKMITREVEVPCTWTEWVRVVTPVTRKETTWMRQMKEVPVRHRVCEWYSVPEKVRVTKYRTETVQEPYRYHACEAVSKPVKRVVTSYRYEPREVIEQVQACRMIGSSLGSRCCGVGSVCAPAWETCQVKRMVMQCIPEHKEVVVNEVSYRSVVKEGVRSVARCIPYQEEVTVNVAKQRWVEQVGRQMVCEMVPVTRDVTREVVTCKPVQRQSVQKRVICEWKHEKAIVNERFCVMVPYETVVKVPSSTCNQSSCNPCTDQVRCGHKSHFRGLFERCGGGCK